MTTEGEIKVGCCCVAVEVANPRDRESGVGIGECRSSYCSEFASARADTWPIFIKPSWSEFLRRYNGRCWAEL